MEMARQFTLKTSSLGQEKDDLSLPKPCLVLAQAEIPQVVEIGRQYELVKEEYLISNAKEADIQIPSVIKPEYRLKIYKQESGWRFENLSLGKNIYVNCSLNQEGPLHDGDFLQIGQTVYEFLSGTGWQSGIYYAMRQAIRIDAHTKAFNKAHFWESLEQWIAFSQRHKKPLSLAMIDLDNFKKLNTDYGHLAADEVLKMFSHRIRSRLRKEDSFYRFGGEEFMVILPETTLLKAVIFMDEIRMAIRQELFLVHEQEIPLTVSIGVAGFKKGMTDQKLYQKSNQNMLEAKKTGKDKVLS